MNRKAEGVLLHAPESRFGSKVFFCENGRRHWVMDAKWLTENALVWPDDLVQVSADVIEAFNPAGVAPYAWTDADRENPKVTSATDLRQIMVSDLRGSGIEVGAGANPMPLPFSCSVRFVDFYDKSGLEENSYDGQHLNDIVRPDIVGTFEDLSGVQDDSLDFVVACHVIEHTRDPIGAIYNSYRKLRKGGTIALVIPDMTRTFDRDRERTQLSHLIDDFRAPDRERDAAHFREFYSVGLPVKPSEFEQHWRQKWTEAYPIHYHTWTYESFKEMIGWIDANVCKFERIWSQPAITGQADCIEFYFSMTK